MAAPPPQRPWARLAVVLAALVGLYSFMAVSGHSTPELGLDLHGGTLVVLTPQAIAKHKRVTTAALNEAVNIIQERVNGLGVSSATVVRQGQNILIEVPGKSRNSVLGLVGQTAQLRFRQVLASAPASTPNALPSAKSLKGHPAPGSLAAAELAYNSMNCKVPRPATYVDTPGEYIAACSSNGSVKYLLAPATVEGTDVATAYSSASTSSAGNVSVTTGAWQVNLVFTSKGQAAWTALTKKALHKQVAVVLDGVVESAPVIQSVIYGNAQITGNFTQTQASNLANVLKYGALPLAFVTSTAQSISASLGASSLRAGLLAGALGLLLVIIYVFIYYRALGLITIASLSVSGLLVYGAVTVLGQAMGFTLTLAGIAGLIVSVGITADSFVVFYERLKDEVREGRTVRSGVVYAWVRARRTILSADAVSFLAALILYLVSIGDVRGFAFTLGLSTLLDIFVVFLFTRPVVGFAVNRKFFSTGRASGLSAGHAGITAPRVGARTGLRSREA